ncbi:hypothetical protein GALMADRAFT_43694, partial [Galerina marginata CBS 339.88]
TESLSPSAQEVILNKQPLRRPSSPHLTIYQPQLTSIVSIANRITGAGLSVLLYGFSTAYLIAPGNFYTHVVEVIAGLPEGVKYAGKAILAAPFAFHSINNGLRHLSWDLVNFYEFTSVKGVYITGYIVLGATAVSTVALALMK